MAVPKLIRLYEGFDPEARVRFREMVNSPFFNRRVKLIRLLAYIQDDASEGWNKQAAFSTIFGERTFDEIQLNNLVSDLYKLAEYFLSLEQFEKNHSLREQMLIESLIEGGDRSIVEKRVARKSGHFKPAGAYPQFARHILADRFRFQHSRTIDNSDLIAGRELLQQLYVAEQLKIWCELLNRSMVMAAHVDEAKLSIFNRTLDLLLPESADNAIVILYHPVFKWMQEPSDDEWYAGYTEKLLQHIGDIPAEDARELCNYVQNYCVKRINEARPGFLQELFRLFKLMLDLDLLREGNHIPQWTFKNIVTVGVRLKAYGWTEQFIHTYYKLLPPEERENAYQYNLAVFYYESGDPDNAQALLNKVQFTDPIYYLDAKCILLKIYFEANAFEPLFSLRDSVKIYLMRNRILNKGQKAQYMNLFAFTAKLFKLRIDRGIAGADKWKKDFRKLLSDVAHQPAVANKQWLEQQINMLLSAK